LYHDNPPLQSLIILEVVTNVAIDKATTSTNKEATTQMPQIVHLECNQKTFVDQMEFLCRNKILDAI